MPLGGYIGERYQLDSLVYFTEKRDTNSNGRTQADQQNMENLL